MAILIDEKKRVLVQGITGREGQARTRLMREYGTNVVAGTRGAKWKPRPQRMPDFVHTSSAKPFPVKGGRVWIDTARWPEIRGFVETQSGGLIVDRGNAPFVTVPEEEFATKDSELLACSVESRLNGVEGFYLELEVPGLNELVGGAR